MQCPTEDDGCYDANVCGCRVRLTFMQTMAQQVSASEVGD